MYGTAPAYPKSRVTKTAFKNDKKITVEPNMDWKAGDMIGIAASNMRTMDYDECTIVSYDTGSGEIECTTKLEGYHYGASSATVDGDYEVDMRSEVWLMNRNIKIQASLDDIGYILKEPWGCQIIVSDFREPTLVQRKGFLNLDNVQVYNCSQKMTYKGAIRFENAIKGASKVSNSVISSGRGMGIVIESSANVELKDNVVADFFQ